MTQRSMLDPQQLPHQLTAIAEQAEVFVNQSRTAKNGDGVPRSSRNRMSSMTHDSVCRI